MLQQQINSAQLQNLAAVQQVNMSVTGKYSQYRNMQNNILSKSFSSLSFFSLIKATLAASRQSNTPSNSMSQATTTVSFLLHVVRLMFSTLSEESIPV